MKITNRFKSKICFTVIRIGGEIVLVFIDLLFIFNVFIILFIFY